MRPRRYRRQQPEKKLPDFSRCFRTVFLDPDDKEILFRNLVEKELQLMNQEKPEEPLQYSGLLPSIGETPFRSDSNVNFLLHPDDQIRPTRSSN